MSVSDQLTASSAVRAAVDIRRFPWIRPLVGAYAHDFASVAPLFAGNPADPDAWRETVARVQRAPRNRDAIVAVLDAQLSRRHAPAEARASLATLADPASVAIVTGQQAGLFGGPLYTVMKAVTAIQLAQRVRDELNTPAVPIFWVDEEDHDWEEIRAAEVLDAELTPRRVSLADVPGAGAHTISRLRLDEGINDAIAELEQTMASSEFTADVIARLRRHYRPGAGMSASFATWIEDLFSAHGLVVFESGDPAAKPLVADLFARELEHPGRTAELARRAGAEMTRLGHEPQVDPGADSVALFCIDEWGRHPIKIRGDEYVMAERACPRAALADEARQSPERFSPNVLLRPLVQDRLFPTACYVSGPSELAYQAQLKDIYREFGVELPLLYNRASATLLDSASVRFLERHDVSLEALHVQDESVLNKVLERQLPPTIERTLEDTAREIVRRADVLKQEVAPVDPTLRGAVDTTAERMQEALKTLHHKIVQASKRKDETLRRQFTRARSLAFPNGHPQERTLSVVFALNRYGPFVCDRLVETLPLDTGKHYVLTL